MAAKGKKQEDGAMELKWDEKGAFRVAAVDGVFAEADGVTAEVLKSATGAEKPRVLLVADANVVQRTEGLGSRIGRYFQANGIALAAPPVVIGGGEKIKADNMLSVIKVAEAAIDANIAANDAIVALGGGSLLDVAGYAASLVRGGIRLVRVPTTAPAMVDSAFSLKASIDAKGVKDVYSVASRPAAVIIDPAFLATVLDGVWRGGISELIRHAAVRDAALAKRLCAEAAELRSRDMEKMKELVLLAVASRAAKGGSDFALWCAHRLESMSAFKLPHGYAVAMAICIECAYAAEKGLMKESEQEMICRALAECGALDGLNHSNHLLAQPEFVLKGLDHWALATGSCERTVPGGIGKAKIDAEPDRDAYRKVIAAFLSASRAGGGE